MPKNSLSIRLTESAVFLRTDENNARRRRNPAHAAAQTPTSVLRGLLTLSLVKPTKIKSIDIQLQARSSTSWPEGVGARHVDIQEDHKLFTQSIQFFRAGPASRRTVSVGPGLDTWHSDEFPQAQSARDATPTPEDFPLPTPAPRQFSVDSSYFHLNTSFEHVPAYSPATPPRSNGNTHARPTPSTSRSRLEEDPAHALEDFRNTLNASLTPSRSRGGDRSPGTMSSFFDADRSLSRRPSIDTLAEADEDGATTNGSSSPVDRRGRRSRFSLASVSNVLKEAVRSRSPRTHASKEREESNRRGRPREKLERWEPTRDAILPVKEEPKDKDHGESWKEFKKGTYSFPISFTIPSTAPPTIQCDYGNVTWRLKANVHRPGAFTTKLQAAREVLVIAAPVEDETEDTETVVVERFWEQQMQYVVSINGRSFPVGGKIPISLNFMPLDKIKIHRITIMLEGAYLTLLTFLCTQPSIEKVEYQSQVKKIIRTDPPARFVLLLVKNNDGGPILPLSSNSGDALEHSPLVAMMDAEEDLSELASSWMGPGPWQFNRDLSLPASCASVHFTNKNKSANICVTHMLKFMFRVERGDSEIALDPKTGNPKLFDIVVQTPVHILSCRCNPEWMSLPQYSSSFEDPADELPPCPCKERRTNLRRVHSTDSSSSHGDRAHARQSLLAQNTLFERLVSGLESEAGEAPPAYA
ncbi:unnamed protein product [Mycena citricolor]|uniref:Arrestin C-terminal-like domain-containing protein n=1 Tax=Mycena citricolor TaxID=2018698 RepID=A0AAD2HTZ4_9AGAR|nr:unnamed protein product [Mycena citricolor]